MGRQRKDHNWCAALRIFANQTAHWFGYDLCGHCENFAELRLELPCRHPPAINSAGLFSPPLSRLFVFTRKRTKWIQVPGVKLEARLNWENFLNVSKQILSWKQMLLPFPFPYFISFLSHRLLWDLFEYARKYEFFFQSQETKFSRTSAQLAQCVNIANC